MAQLQILTQFKQLFDDVKLSLNHYNNNLRNELFEIEPNENNEQAYKRGEIIFDKRQDDIRNLNEILNQQEAINKFFEKCKENKQILINQNNKLINKLIEIQKNNPNISKQDFVEYREFWNEKRIETEVEKMNRETKEMLEEIKEEKKYIEEMRNKMMNEKIELEQTIEKAKKEKNEINFEEEKKNTEKKQMRQSPFYSMKNENDEMKKIMKQKTAPIQKSLNELPIESISIPNLNEEQIAQLEEWTLLKCSDIVFDSNKDNWSEDTSVFNESIVGKRQLIFLIEDEDGEKFGYYLNTKVIEKYNDYIGTDFKSFKFNLQSQFGRLSQPMKYEMKELYESGIILWGKTNDSLITLGDIYLMKENKKNESCCEENKDKFEYYGISNALCGKIYPKTFTPKRIIVIQML